MAESMQYGMHLETGGGRPRVWLLTMACLLVGLALAGGVAAAADAPIEEEAIAQFDADGDAFRIEYRYSTPSEVTAMEITHPSLTASEITVTGTENLKRVDETTFEWDGHGTPVIELEHAVSGQTFTQGTYGYVTDDAAFTGLPAGQIWYRSYGNHERVRTYRFDGEGFAGEGFVYAGEFDRSTRRVNGESIELIVADEVTEPIDVEGVLDLYETGHRHFDGRFPASRATLFVLPSNRRGDRPGGHVVRSAIWIDEAKMGIEAVDNTPSHEYAHVRLGIFGTDEMYWLKEGAAQYYGHALSLNAGIGTFEEFLETVRTEQFTKTILTDSSTMMQIPADYYKGAHVVAALDAEIRIRSNGRNTFHDVLVTEEHDLSTYEGFEAAVVDAADDSEMRQWLDRYVRSDGVPNIPEQRRYYTLGDRSPKSIPTATPTPTPTPTPTATPTPSTNPTATATTLTDAAPASKKPAATETDPLFFPTATPTEEKQYGLIDDYSDAAGPGFGVLAALTALLSLGWLRRDTR